MKVTVQYYDGPPANAKKLAEEAKKRSDQAANVAASTKTETAKKAAASALAASKKADDDAALKATPGLRDEVKAVAEQRGLQVHTVNQQNEYIEVSGLDQAKALMADLSPIANIQIQTAP